MREIKFKAWFPKSCYMIYFDLLASEAIRRRLSSTENPIIMQYTDLNDKNGKEIYEGDILKDHHLVLFSAKKGEIYVDCYAVVTWLHGGFYARQIGDEKLRSLSIENYEIIGNICENPELLKND